MKIQKYTNACGCNRMMYMLSRDIVDCVVGIMEDRPEPRRNYKPVQKIKNGLEKFWATHQERYEAREKTSGSKVNRVNRHNAACPKMIDELDRRRATTKVAVVAAKKDVKLKRDPICNGCLKKERLRRRHLKSKGKSRYHHVSSRIKKKRRRNLPISVNAASQCANVLIKDKNVATDAIFKMDSKINVNLSLLTDAVKIRKAGKKPDTASKQQSKSMNSSRNPDSSIASISSYNSYPTLDQEPMV